MAVAEVGRIEGVGGGVMGLLRLWKCVEKRGIGKVKIGNTKFEIGEYEQKSGMAEKRATVCENQNRKR